MDAQAMIRAQPAQRLLPTPQPAAFGRGCAQEGLAGGIAMILSAALLSGVKGYDFTLARQSALFADHAHILDQYATATPALV